ncbi:MAG TPA: hemolysin III family protein [Proteobacteria bacterium]|nr:hemolysin III family protein [Pseudomonadota bacterium]
MTARYTLREEIASSLIHGAGTLLALTALVIMVAYAVRSGTIVHVTGAAVYGGGLIFAYLSSTLYHSVQRVRAKAIFRMFDHISIYILIAATYTPLTLINLRGPWGWSLFGVVWGLALLGVIVECSSLRRFRLASILLYLGMGWAVIAAIRPLLVLLHKEGFILFLGGGLFYTVGCLFYAWRQLPYNHAIWHLFVIAGSACHFFAVIYYVLPVKL